MRTEKSRAGMACLVGVSCLCILSSIVPALADGGGSIRTLPVSMAAGERASLSGSVLLYIDEAGEQVKATPVGDGAWTLELPATQRKVVLLLERADLGLQTCEVDLPADLNATLEVSLHRSTMSVEVVSSTAHTATGQSAVDSSSLSWNTPAGGARQGGDTCATGTPVVALPYTAVGTTLGYTDDYDEVCPYSGSTSPDVVYMYLSGVDTVIDITLCNGSAYDTKLYVYEGLCTGLNQIACNDDTCPGYVSELQDVPIIANQIYYIVVDGYGGDSGSYVIDITENAPAVCGDGTCDTAGGEDCANCEVDCGVCPPGQNCPVDSLFSQEPHGPNDSWSFGTSEINANGTNYLRAESFAGLTLPICDIHWWGLSLYNDGLGWNPCTDSDPTFDIKFYQDAGGAPGAVVATHTVAATVVPTGVLYAGLYEMNYYSVDLLSPCVLLTDGWVSIQGLGDATCWFLWASALTGDGSSYFSIDGVPDPAGYFFDNAVCLTGPGDPIYGACCDDDTGSCADGVDMVNCTGRFEADTLCADLAPPCGNPGACCNDDTGVCVDGVNEVDCIGRHAPGTLCANLDPACGAWQPTGACCDPVTEACYPDKTQAQCDAAVGPGNWHEGLPCDPNPCVSTCDHTITLIDSYGDGWNGGQVEVFVEGVSQGVFTLASGGGPLSYTFPAGTGDLITTVYTAGGWSYENEYYVYDVNGDLIFSDGSGGNTPTGGSGLGNCGPDPCLGNEPANDDCPTATAITGPYPVTVSGDNTCASVDCVGVLDWNATWWAIDLPYASNNLTLDYCGSPQEIWSIGIVTYASCPGDCNAYTIADGYSFDTCTVDLTNPNMHWDTVPGPTTVYLPVHAVLEDGTRLPYSVTVNVTEFIPPTNDFCADAIPVAVPSLTPGTTQGTTTDTGAPSCPGASITSPGVWYSVMGTGNTMTASLCNGATNYDAKLTAYCGDCADLGALTCVAGNDDTCGLQPEISWCSQVGAEYLVLVHGFGGANGPFELEITDDGASCSAEVACLPEGACCLPDGSCVITTVDDCAAQGGAYNGDDTDCSGAVATDATITIEILTDSWGSETSWVLVDENGAEVATGDGMSSNTLYTTDVPAYSTGCYAFTIFDSYGDGICCSYGMGYYNVLLDGILIATGGDFGSSETVANIGGCTGAPTGGGLGACCININESCVVTTEDCCDYAGGVFHGGGTDCGAIGWVAGQCTDPFEDISGSGTLAATASDCDDCGELVPIGFTFNHWGTDHTDIAACSNGYLTFHSDWSDYSNDDIPDTWDPDDFIAPMWDDLNATGTPDGDIHYQTLGTAPDRRLIVQWTNIRQYGNSDSNTFQAVLFEGSNSVSLRYLQITPESYAGDYTIGTENQDGTDGIAFDSSTVAAGDCLTVYYLESDPPCPLCFGLNKVELERSECGCDSDDSDGDSDDADCDEDRDGNGRDDSGDYEVELKGSWIPATPIDLTVDDVSYTIEDGHGYVFDITIPAGSFQAIGGPNHDKWKFDGYIGLLETEAKFDFDKATFKLEVEHFPDNDLLTGTTLTVRIVAGSNVAGETVEAEDHCDELEYKRHPKLDCLADGVSRLQVASSQGVFEYLPAQGQDALPDDTVVDDGVNGPVTIHTSGSQPLDVGEVFYTASGVGAYVVVDVDKIFTEYSLGVESNLRGTPIQVDQLDLYGDSNDTTELGLVYTDGELVTLTAPQFHGIRVFHHWTVDGVRQPTGVNTIQVSVAGQDHTVKSNYVMRRRTKPGGVGTQEIVDVLPVTR